MSDVQRSYVVGLEQVSMRDVARVGGKNASLGELIRELQKAGVRVAGGFATTTAAYWDFLAANGLRERIDHVLSQYRGGRVSLEEAGSRIRARILQGALPDGLAREIAASYRDLNHGRGRTSTSPCALARLPRICPKRASPASRRRS